MNRRRGNWIAVLALYGASTAKNGGTARRCLSCEWSQCFTDSGQPPEVVGRTEDTETGIRTKKMGTYGMFRLSAPLMGLDLHAGSSMSQRYVVVEPNAEVMGAYNGKIDNSRRCCRAFWPSALITRLLYIFLPFPIDSSFLNRTTAITVLPLRWLPGLQPQTNEMQ